MREVLLVTGSSGIAAATARLWAAHDPVFIVSANEEECRALTSQLPEADFAVADVRNETAVNRSLHPACSDSAELMPSLMWLGSVHVRWGMVHCTHVRPKRGT